MCMDKLPYGLLLLATLTAIWSEPAQAVGDIFSRNWRTGQVVQQQITIPPTGSPCKGELFACGVEHPFVMGIRRTNCLQCGTVVATVPAGKDILRVDVTCRETAWISTDPTKWADPTIGWFALEDYSTRWNPDGSFSASARAKNWSENQPRQLRIQIWYK
jgi:hypothetical protein